MKMSALLFLVSASALAGGLSGCGVSETEADRFEVAAGKIASIPLQPEAEPLAEASGPRADSAPLRVELMTPHQLWDARDGLAPKAARIITLNQADVSAVDGPVVPPVAEPMPVAAPAGRVRAEAETSSRTIQLGAYANRASAQSAWGRLGAVTQGLTPVFEPVTVNGRDLVRLKVRAQSDQAQALCAVAAASDSWCMKAAR